MVAKDESKILEYLKKYGQTNTFKLATQLGIDVSRILKIIKKLEEKQAVEVRSGVAKFLEFPVKEKKQKKPIRIKKVPKPKKKVKPRKAIAKRRINLLKKLEDENKELREKIKELQKKVSKPKIIRKTIIKKIPIKVKEKIPKPSIKLPKKFKLPKINLSGLMKNIKRLDIPEILKK